METKNGLRTWVEIDTKAIRQNYQAIRRLLSSKTKLMAVIKSNAYGHDLISFAKLITACGADSLAVDSITEALALRQNNVRSPILVLGYTLDEHLSQAGTHQIVLTVSSFESLNALKKQPTEFHLKIDTGMHRQGFLPKQWPKLIQELNRTPGLKKLATGLFTHFAAAQNPAFRQDTRKQISLFRQAADLFAQNGFRLAKHAAATSGTILFPEAHFDLVRPGIGLYGIWPDQAVKSAYKDKFTLKPVLSWKTIVSEVKKLPAGEKIGYEWTETLERPTNLALCPIGYWHGLPRALSSIGRVVIRGKKCRLVGRVSMDMIAVDATEVPVVKVGSEVTLIGPGVTADDMAALAGTSTYEILTRLNPLMRRIYL